MERYIICKCKSKILKTSYKKHTQTTKHINYINKEKYDKRLCNMCIII